MLKSFRIKIEDATYTQTIDILLHLGYKIYSGSLSATDTGGFSFLANEYGGKVYRVYDRGLAEITFNTIGEFVDAHIQNKIEKSVLTHKRIVELQAELDELKKSL